MSRASAAPRRNLILRASWTLRFLSLFLLGPVIGLILINAAFGLAQDIILVATGMFVFSLALFGILVRGEVRRLSRPTGR